ncbi:MAG: hypothetical protein ABR986_10370 [Methanomassiliicoccales archaeon]|jgi:hypothetical protein
MAKKKATPVDVEEEVKKEEILFEESGNWKEPSGGMMPQEAAGHLMKAATEFLGAMDTMMPKKKKMPDEVRVHYMAAKKEMLLMARAMLDAKIAACDGEKAEEEPRVKKINLE